MQGFDEQRIRHILSCSPAIIYTGRVHEPFNLTFVSDNFPSLFGHHTQDCLGRPAFWRDHIHPDDCDCVFADYAALVKTGHHVHEYRLRNKAGDYLWVLDELRLVRDTEGRPVEVIGSLLDISDRKRAEIALQKSEELFRVFFLANPVPTIISSPEGVVLMVNPAFTKNPGYPAEDVVGRTVQELGFWRNPDDRARMVAAIKEHGCIDNLESQFHGKGQRPMTCLISSRAIDLAGELRILSIVNDVTEARKAEDALRKLDQAKSDFISTAAHELRTPLIAIVGFSELLEDAAGMGLTEEQKASYIAVIQSNAEILKSLVDDLLDVGRIQIGRSLGVVFAENNLGEIIRKVVEPFRLKNQQHNIIVTHKTPLPERVWLDGGRITQVLYNLLNNAIKYSPHGGVIEIQTSTSPDEVSIAVLDQGVGMTPQQVDHVFDRFYRAEFDKTHSSGLGLGLSIVKQIVADHGGEIAVASQLGVGTAVTLSLPIKQSKPGSQ